MTDFKKYLFYRVYLFLSIFNQGKRITSTMGDVSQCTFLLYNSPPPFGSSSNLIPFDKRGPCIYIFVVNKMKTLVWLFCLCLNYFYIQSRAFFINNITEIPHSSGKIGFKTEFTRLVQ